MTNYLGLQSHRRSRLLLGFLRILISSYILYIMNQLDEEFVERLNLELADLLDAENRRIMMKLWRDWKHIFAVFIVFFILISQVFENRNSYK